MVLGLRVLQSERQPDLKPWHTWAPRELDAGEIDEIDWPDGWRGAADALFREVRRPHARRDREHRDRVPANRYFEGSPLHPGALRARLESLLPAAADRRAQRRRGVAAWTFRFALLAAPCGPGLRRAWFCRGGVRLPGHGTVPAGLTSARWQDWRAATRLAMREARRLAGRRQTAAHRRIFEWRRARHAVRARCGVRRNPRSMLQRAWCCSRP